MSYLTQMLGLAVQNFLSAATGMAVLVALIRGFVRREAQHIGNFWVDFTRSTLYVLLPLSALLAVVLVSQGVVQSFEPYQSVDPRGTDRRGDARDRAGRAARSGRQPGGHQAAGHQRRRLLQRQLGAPAREPDAALEFPGGARHPADPGGALLHLRPHGWRHPAGLGGAGGDAGHLRAADARRDGRGAGRQSPLRRPGHRSGRVGARSRAATWRARRPASASPTRRCGPPPRRPPPMAP